MNTQEIYKTIPGYERYKISNHGNIWSLIRGRQLKPRRNNKGYMVIWLCNKDKKCMGLYVHRLLLLAFQGPSELEVNHKNGIKDDNNLENLEYCTSAENSAHAIKTGLSSPGDYHAMAITAYKDGQYVGEYPSQSEASRVLNVHQQNISHVVNGRRKTAGGYSFKQKLSVLEKYKV